MELVRLKKGDKVITRTKFDYDKKFYSLENERF